MPRYPVAVLAVLAVLALIACAPPAPSDGDEETWGLSSSEVLPDRRARGERTTDAGADAAPRPSRPTPVGRPEARPDAAPPEPSPANADDCKDKGLPVGARFCGRSPGTEQILYRCENNDWVEVSHCVAACEVNSTFGKDACK